MENTNETEEQIQRRERIAQINKKKASSRFLVFVCLFQTLVTLLIMCGLFASFLGIVSLLGEGVAQAIGSYVTIVLIVIFIGGYILGFIVYKKFVRWYIKKNDLINKINEDVISHYYTKSEIEEQLKK